MERKDEDKYFVMPSKGEIENVSEKPRSIMALYYGFVPTVSSLRISVQIVNREIMLEIRRRENCVEIYLGFVKVE